MLLLSLATGLLSKMMIVNFVILVVVISTEHCIKMLKKLTSTLLCDIMKLMWMISVFALVILIKGLSLPQLKWYRSKLTNNSYIHYDWIFDGDRALKCVTNCCNDSDVGNWRDGRGRLVHQGTDGDNCLYVTRGQGMINLNRKRDCIPDASGLWRCDIPDSSDMMQSIYIYISNDTTSGKTA